MKIGNIVTTDRVNASEDFNIVTSMDSIIEGIPTLIVDWNYIKTHYPEYDILHHQVSENIFWTFKKNEFRSQHEEDIYHFIENTYTNLIKNINYVFIDPLILDLKSKKKIIKKLNSLNNPIAYKDAYMVYIYAENLIFGLNLELFTFVGLNTEKILRRIKTGSAHFLIREDIFEEYKRRIENLDNQVKYIPYLYSILNA